MCLIEQTRPVERTTPCQSRLLFVLARKCWEIPCALTTLFLYESVLLSNVSFVSVWRMVMCEELEASLVCIELQVRSKSHYVFSGLISASPVTSIC